MYHNLTHNTTEGLRTPMTVDSRVSHVRHVCMSGGLPVPQVVHTRFAASLMLA